MIVHEVSVPYKYGDEFRLKALFDAHIGDNHCDVMAIKEYLKDSDEKTYLILGGDTFAGILLKDIRRYLKSFDESVDDDILGWEIKRANEIISSSYKGNILGMMIGNHESAILKHHSFHLGRQLASLLNTVSLGYSCIIRMKFSEEGSRGRTLLIYAHHGFGGGSRTQGADLTKYCRHASSWECDIFLYGHVHRLQSDKIDRMSVVGTRLIPKPKYLYICGTFQKTLSLSDIPTYAEEKGYPPVSIGAPTITIRPDRTWLTIESDIG